VHVYYCFILLLKAINQTAHARGQATAACGSHG